MWENQIRHTTPTQGTAHSMRRLPKPLNDNRIETRPILTQPTPQRGRPLSPQGVKQKIRASRGPRSRSVSRNNLHLMPPSLSQCGTRTQYRLGRPT